MKRLLALSLPVLAGALAAQGKPAVVDAAAPLQASLTPTQRVVPSGAPVELILRVTAAADTDVDATVLRGVHLTRAIGESAAITIGAAEAGTVRVAKGTTIERLLKVDLQTAAPADGGLAHVTVAWPGLAGATAALDVAPEQASIDVDKLDYTKTKVLVFTNFGAMTISFFADKAPNHAKNFAKLAKSGFYDGTRFHRIIRGFMIQGGCPNTKAGATGEPGTGDPGYKIDAEFNDVRHVRGVLSMARGPDPNSAGCQFFLCHGEAPHLDRQYSAFAKVDEGLDTLDKIASVPVTPNRMGENSVPTQAVQLLQAIVLPVYKK